MRVSLAHGSVLLFLCLDFEPVASNPASHQEISLLPLSRLDSDMVPMRISPFLCSSRSRGYNLHSPSITNGYALVLLLPALVTVTVVRSSASIVNSTDANVSALSEHLSTEKALGMQRGKNEEFTAGSQVAPGSAYRQEEQRQHCDPFTASSRLQRVAAVANAAAAPTYPRHAHSSAPALALALSLC